MKTGAIVYVLGGVSTEKEIDVENALKDLDIEADRVEVVFPESGQFDVMDAWWALMRKGVHRVVCMTAEIVNPSKLRLTGHELRLYG